jgi:ABC-type multidrug transport system ATPase subunit
VIITDLNLPSGEGLSNIKMNKLGNIVLIAGKNGAGKTRLLRRITSFATTRPYQPEMQNLQQSITHFEKTIQSNPNDVNVIQWQNQITSHKDRLKIREYVTVNDEMEAAKIIEFVPKNLNLQDSSDMSPSLMQSAAQSIASPGTNNLNQGTLAYIQTLQNRWWNVTHPSSEVNEEQTGEIIVQYDRLKELIRTFLNTDLGRDANGFGTLFGFPLGQSQLSDGQKVLLQLCMAIYAQKASLSNMILIMDEPENHLHPSVLLEVINQIKENITDGQLWISTHSIPLLSSFNPSLIWYMDEGSISYAGRSPEKVLRGLLGDEEQISSLSEFLTLPAQFATNQYAFECLLAPTVVMTPATDVQTTQIKEALVEMGQGRSMTVLDLGAGKGRLLDNIYYSEHIQNREQITQWLDYIAFDLSSEDRALCESTISRVYGNTVNRYFNNDDDLRAAKNDESFDIVVMCNVLHEIEPAAWLHILGANSLINRVLKDSGHLLIVEDCQLPVGEKAHKHGFIVLNRFQIMKLFNIRAEETDFKYSDARNDGRLLAYRIPKRFLSRISAASRIDALNSLTDTARNEIRRLRDQEASYINGLRHGFWVQQFANAQLALEELQ